MRDMSHPAAPLDPQTCEGVRKGTAGLQNFPQKRIGQVFTRTRKAGFLSARKQAVQTGNIQILDNNTAGYREVPHCMAQKESAEEARSPEPGLGEEAGSPTRGLLNPQWRPQSSAALPHSTASGRIQGNFLGNSLN